MARITIDKKIVKYSVAKDEEPAKPAPQAKPESESNVIRMHEKLERPEVLIGSTYKIKTPVSDHAMYVTINDIILNEGTPHEMRRPFEIFINSKNLDHFQWIVALTRIISAVFRKGGDVTFLVEEMKAVFDPRGGYFKAGGIYMPSIVAEIGAVVEDHLKMIGLIHDPELSDAQKVLIAEKRAQYEANVKKNAEVTGPQKRSKSVVGGASAPIEAPAPADHATGSPTTGFPPGATMCAKCSTQAVILMDGCATCLSCGYSKCG